MQHYDSKIIILGGLINGINKNFTTPTKYVSGTIRIILNGQIYEYDDENYGWNEVDENTISMIEAPLTGDVLQAFYQDKETSHLAWDGIKGSPFDPHGIIP